jgi:acyl-CoA reductase-like NAD-dependent aldehyde dehydrogenase
MKSGLYVDGAWLDTADRAVREVVNPWDGTVVATLADATAQDVDAAVTAAVRVMADAPLAPYRRYEILARTAEWMAEQAEEFAQLLVAESGKPIRAARAEVTRSTHALQLCAEEAKRLGGQVVPLDGAPGSEHRLAFTLPTPIGPVCAIAAFNAPLIQFIHKVPTALAAGCAVVAKPAERTPLSAIRFTEIAAEAGLPAGWLNLLLGAGPTGDALLTDERLAAYTFTGSVAVGRHIHQSVGLRKTILELGNNSPSIVHHDADLETAATAITRSGFAYAGQLCVSAQRVLVHSAVHDELLDRLVAKAEALNVGDPSLDSTDIGPMISTSAVKRARELIDGTVAEGATLVTGGIGDDRTLSPTILDAVRPDMQIALEEAFAPVIAILTYDDVDEALALANATRYGLQAAVFTESLDVAMHLGQHVDTGTVVVNDGSDVRLDQMPFGGVKDSGLGREGIRYTIDDFTTPRLMVLTLKTPR